MLYDVELDLNESSKGREQIFKQILLQLSIIEGYKGDLWALFHVSSVALQFWGFFSSKWYQLILLIIYLHIIPIFLDQMSFFEGYSTTVFAPQILVT